MVWISGFCCMYKYHYLISTSPISWSSSSILFRLPSLHVDFQPTTLSSNLHAWGNYVPRGKSSSFAYLMYVCLRHVKTTTKKSKQKNVLLPLMICNTWGTTALDHLRARLPKKSRLDLRRTNENVNWKYRWEIALLYAEPWNSLKCLAK